MLRIVNSYKIYFLHHTIYLSCRSSNSITLGNYWLRKTPILRHFQRFEYPFVILNTPTENLNTLTDKLDSATESQLILFIGVMSGVGAANKVVTKLFGETAMRAVAKKIAAKALTKTWYYPIAKKIAGMLGQKLVKATFAKGVSKAVPILGGVVSGGLTLATFKPMAHRLQKHLSTMAHMSPEEFAKYEAAIVIDTENSDTGAENAEVVTEETATNFWVCTCGSENKGKFCAACGKAKLAGIPQYKCDKCGWEPDDNTQPPKFCPECGDPFDDGDIVLV